MVFRALLECSPWHQDHDVVEMPWRTEKDNDITSGAGVPGSTPGRPVFGMMTCDGNVRPTLPIKRALTHVRHVGYTVNKGIYRYLNVVPGGHRSYV
jgi:hypothetical protein